MHKFELAGVSDSLPTPLIRYTDSCDGQVEWTQTASDSDRLGTLKNGTPTEEKEVTILVYPLHKSPQTMPIINKAATSMFFSLFFSVTRFLQFRASHI